MADTYPHPWPRHPNGALVWPVRNAADTRNMFEATQDVTRDVLWTLVHAGGEIVSTNATRDLYEALADNPGYNDRVAYIVPRSFTMWLSEMDAGGVITREVVGKRTHAIRLAVPVDGLPGPDPHARNLRAAARVADNAAEVPTAPPTPPEPPPATAEAGDDAPAVCGRELAVDGVIRRALAEEAQAMAPEVFADLEPPSATFIDTAPGVTIRELSRALLAEVMDVLSSPPQTANDSDVETHVRAQLSHYRAENEKLRRKISSLEAEAETRKRETRGVRRELAAVREENEMLSANLEAVLRSAHNAAAEDERAFRELDRLVRTAPGLQRYIAGA